MKTWQIAAGGIVLAAVSGWAGYQVHGTIAPPVIVSTEDEYRASASWDMRQDIAASQSTSILAITPTVDTKRTIKRYHPPVAGCVAPGAVACVCPGPGPIAEEIDEHVKTGPGSIATNTDTRTNASTGASGKAEESGKSSRTEAPANLPKWALTLQLGMSLKEPAAPIPGLPHVVVGGAVERHVGTVPLLDVPVSVGAWVSSVGAGGFQTTGRF